MYKNLKKLLDIGLNLGTTSFCINSANFCFGYDELNDDYKVVVGIFYFSEGCDSKY